MRLNILEITKCAKVGEEYGVQNLTTARQAKGYDVLATFDYGNSQYFLVNLPSGVAYGPGLFNASI